LNPQKVSGVCGRLLCCLSYENEQYRQMKAIMPRLGQPIQTPAGPGMVVAMQILRETITVRLEDENREEVFPADQLGFGSPRPAATDTTPVAAPDSPTFGQPVGLADLSPPDAVQVPVDEPESERDAEPDGTGSTTAERSAARSRSRRRRRRGNRSGGAPNNQA
jgi:hypothetical protein